MYLHFSDEQRAFRDSVRGFLASQAPISYVRSMCDDERGTTDDVWRGLVELGIPALLIPQRYGGLGMGMVDMGCALEELGRALHPGPYFSSSVTATLAILAVGNDDESELLAQMAAGTCIATLALLEPESRYRWARPRVLAALSSSGEWTLTGIKVHVPDAHRADVILVPAAAGEEVGLFAIRRKLVEVSPEDVLDRSRKWATVKLADVPATRIGGGDATVAMARVLDRVLIGLVIDGVGTAQAALDRCVDYSKVRVQFGSVIGAFQAVQKMCVDMFAAIETSRILAYHGLWAADQGDPDECHRAATMAKGYASDALAGVGETAIQIHGGIGVTWEHDIGLFYKRCLSTQSSFGRSREHLEELATIIIPER